LFNIDLSVFKTVTLKERCKMQFRAEALNVTNTVLFASPSTNISSLGTFGTNTATPTFRGSSSWGHVLRSKEENRKVVNPPAHRVQRA
jgi:hypothetical protein